MEVMPAVAIRNKILGTLLRHARLRAGKSPEDFAAVLDCSVDEVLAWESGEKGITLPQLEVWAYMCSVPLHFFWDENALPPEREIEEPVEELLAIRRRMVGVLLHQSRLVAARSLEEVAEAIGVSPEFLEACEQGREELTVAQLELAAEACDVPVETFFAEHLFPMSEEERRLHDMHRLDSLPEEVREFVLKPSNVLYLKIAMQLSVLSADTLREIAETLLDITF